MLRGFLVLAVLFAFGCGHKKHHHDESGPHSCNGKCDHHKPPPPGAPGAGPMSCEGNLALAPTAKAQATVSSLAKSKVKGDVKFEAAGEDVKVIVNLTGLKANQKHGFHIHEFGNCSAKDGSSAGGHLNPLKAMHAAPTDEHRHLGDLGNITADAKGNAQVEVLAAKTRLSEILGRAVVVHAKEDDLKSQPAGEAGDRVACGVIGLTQ